jgi:Domain of unknown function (DU1801)
MITGRRAILNAMAQEQKTKPSSSDVEAFLDAIPDETRQADSRELCTLMAEVTGEPPVLWGSSIVGFGRYHYRYESGHEGTSALAGFAPRKQHLVLYLVGGFEDRHHKLMADLGPHKTGKGCLYIKRLADVDLDVLRELVDRSVRVRRGVDRTAHRDS